MVPNGISHWLPNGHAYMAWGSPIKGSDSVDVEVLSATAKPGIGMSVEQ